MLKSLLVAGVCALSFLTTPATAQESGMESPSSETADPAYLSLGVGYYDIFDSGDSGAADFRVEYKSGDKILGVVKPWGGFEANNDGSVWAGGGLAADLKAAPNIYITPSFGAGLYGQGGSSKDLGSALEFRSQIEGGYEFMNGHRIGAALSHTSNFDIGDENPGAETLGIYYHVPVAEMF